MAGSQTRSALLLCLTMLRLYSASAIGVNWGTSFSSQPLPPPKVVELLRSNNVTSVRLSEPDPSVMEALIGSGIRVALGVPDSALQGLNSSRKAAEGWVHDNVTRYFSDGSSPGFRIEYVVVGDEPFLQTNNQQFQPFIIGAATNIHQALVGAKLSTRIKVIVPCSHDAFNTTSPLPSKARFRPDLNKTMTQILTFLTKQNSPFLVDLNPYATFHERKNSPLDFSLFHPTARPLTDGHNTYKNSFDASIDSLVASLSALGFPDIDIMVGKIGWPTDGAVNATKRIAETFMKGLVEHLKSNSKTPLRPRKPVLDVYVFSLLDEDRRSVASGDYERHWGVFTFDGQAKYELDLGQGPQKKLSNAHDVEYLMQRWCVANNNNGDLSNASQSMNAACAASDCTALSPGGSCARVGWPGNASYAFNSYYQGHGQGVGTCDFGGLGMITTVDPSVDECRFMVGLRTSWSAGRLRGAETILLVLTVVVVLVL
ncbi:Glucan endo-1,3-beta-glucosidase 9 [Acorus gramineus]|uniref:Glucan endo-1,3-beta-glucosidase 9 n=1 Tax=Acorus gramineus TaxID=55184 RepID=A0AAV9AL57_ACOGR|nr:Glucan endo-1,3-beta-glucosidase 9 [Acorus gramineus]